MIIELGRITVQTQGGGMTYREEIGNECYITRTEYIQQGC